VAPLFVRPGPEGAYFAPTCEEVLGPWFSERDFEVVDKVTGTTRVAWRQPKVFMEFTYWPKDRPDFPVMVGLGFIKDMPFGFFSGPRKPMLQGLGLWEVVTDESDRAILAQSFQDEPSLRRLLTRIRDRTLKYALPLLDDERLMRAAIHHRKRAR
jgi:hypothetical protein